MVAFFCSKAVPEGVDMLEQPDVLGLTPLGQAVAWRAPENTQVMVAALR